MDLLKDDVQKLFYKFLVPAVSSAIAVATYSLIDTIAIGQGVGSDGAAANAVVLPIFSIASFIAVLFGMGGCILRSKAKGAGNEEKGNVYFTASLVWVSIITFVCWIVGIIFQEDFYRICGADDKLMPYVKDYGKWIFAFLPSFVCTTFLGSFIRTDGSPKFVMKVTLVGGIINIIGDWLFVFPLKMGMVGAAIATVMGSMAQVILMIGYILLKKTSLKLIKPYKWLPALKNIFKTGFGSGIGSLSIIIVTFIINNQIMKYSGKDSLAIYGMLGTVSALVTSVFSGIGQAVQPIVSENYGAKNLSRCWKTEKFGIRTTIIFGVLFATVYIVFPVKITGLFMKLTPEIIRIAPYIVRIYALSFIPLAINTFSIYYLQSILCPFTATLISLLRGVVLNSILLFVLPLIFKGNGVWLAILLAEMIVLIVSVVCLISEFKKYRKNN